MRNLCWNCAESSVNHWIVVSGHLFILCLVSFISVWSSIISPDSVRLVDGTSLCSGRLEVKYHQSNQWWSSVCEADFDQQDAEVVCRELGCGTPSVLQGGLYGEVEAPMWNKEFQCGGHESALLDCRSSGSARKSCSPGKAVGLICSGRRGAVDLIWFIYVLMKLTLFFSWWLSCFCSDPVRLVGGASRCAGTLELKQGDWSPVTYSYWTLQEAAVICRELDCGSAVSVGRREESSDRSAWWIWSDCVQSGSSLRDCVTSRDSRFILDLICSGKPVSDIISDTISDRNVSSVFLPLSHWQSVVCAGLNCKVIHGILKCREVGLYPQTAELLLTEHTLRDLSVCLSVCLWSPCQTCDIMPFFRGYFVERHLNVRGGSNWSPPSWGP